MFALVLATLRFKKISWGAAHGRANLSAIEFLDGEIAKKAFEAVNLLSAFVKSDGSQMDLTMRLSQEFDLKSELANGLAKALTKPIVLSGAI